MRRALGTITLMIIIASDEKDVKPRKFLLCGILENKKAKDVARFLVGLKNFLNHAHAMVLISF